jgi:hypothetical protein
MKTLAMAVIAAALPATSASAQFNPYFPTYPFYGPQQGSAFGTDPITRVTTSFRTAIVVTEPLGGDAKAQEAARRVLYGMAEGECTTLSEIFQAERRLSSFAINTPFIAPLPNTPATSMTATAVYELKPIKSRARGDSK